MDRYRPVHAEDKLSFHNLHTAFIHAVHQACHHCCKCIHCRCLGSFRINKSLYTEAEGSQGRARDLDRLTGKCCRTERLNKFAPQNVQRCTMPQKSRRIFYSCSVVEVSRVLSCLCSANLVPVKHSVSISLVKHYSQATGSRREEGMEKKEGTMERKRFHGFLLSFHHSTNMASSFLAPKRVQEVESDQEERWKRRRGGWQRTCVQSRKVCSPSSSDRQTGCLESLFLPQYERSLDGLQQAGSTLLWGF